MDGVFNISIVIHPNFRSAAYRIFPPHARTVVSCTRCLFQTQKLGLEIFMFNLLHVIHIEHATIFCIGGLDQKAAF
jgi:hypothetical protein